MNIYVGNMSYDMSEDDLKGLFEEYGPVSKANIIRDRDTGRAKGFGFVEMDSDDDANKAIEELNGKSVAGRNIKVNQAKPREERPRRSNNRW